MSPKAIEHRLREVARLTNLDPARRIESKIDMSPRAIEHRLREASRLHQLCLKLSATDVAQNDVGLG